MRCPAKPSVLLAFLAGLLAIIAISTRNPVHLLAGITAVLGLVAGPRIYRFLKIDSERRGIEREIPYFVVYAASLHSSGIPLHKSLLMARGSAVFKHMSRQAEILEQLLLVIHDPVDALYQLSHQTPSKEFAQILRSYAGLLRSGGQPHVYLKNLAHYYSRRLEDSWNRFSTLLVEAEEAYLMIYVLGSFLLLLYALLSSATAPLLLFSFFMSPLLGSALLMYIHSEEPGLRLPARTSPIYVASYTASLALFMLAWRAMNLWLALTVCSAPLVAHGIYLELSVRRRALRVRSELMAAFNEIADYVRLGYPLERAIEMVRGDPSLSSETKEILSAIPVSPEALGSSHETLDDNLRYLLTLLAHLGSTYTPPEIFDLVNGFLTTATYATGKARSRVKPYETVMFAYPPVLLYVARKISSMLLPAGTTAASFLPMLAPSMEVVASWPLAALVVVPLLINTFIMGRIEGETFSPMKKGLALAISGVSGFLLSP